VAFVQSFQLCRKSSEKAVREAMNASNQSMKPTAHLRNAFSALQQIFLTAVSADHSHPRFITAGIERGIAYPTCCRHEQLPLIDMEIDCNIDKFEGKEDGRVGVESDRRSIENVQIGRAKRACPDAP
jgi:hypothetical protein